MDNVSVSEIGTAIASLVKSPQLKGHRIIPIGHSAGSSAIMYSTKLFHSADIPYESIVLVEPPMIDRTDFNQHLKDRQGQIAYISLKALLKQQNVWPNPNDARAWLMSRLPWKTWDPNLLNLYIKHGLKENASGTEQQEVYSFSDLEAAFEALDRIALVCKKSAIHVIFGGINDMVPRYSQDTVVDAAKGRKISSVVRIAGAGHLVVQQCSDKLAEHI